MSNDFTVGDPPPGCLCGVPWGSILPAPPCPYHCQQTYYPSIPFTAAWICPRCQRVNAPHASQCTCLPMSTVVTTTTVDTKVSDPSTWSVGTGTKSP